ncbi:hypothetical protein N0V85_008890 [Neurospora sp. IMI 360204]|nr:hypothetical protein N0V85_008890 [Neurospora sp. IMI 360204]
MSERRGRGRGSNRDRYYDDDDYSDYSDYDRPSRSATAPPKRHRSISRRALDRLSSTFGNLGLNKDKDSARTRSSGRYRDGAGDDSDYSTNYTHNKKRPSRSRHHSPDRDRGSGTRSSRYPPRAGLNRQRSYSYSPERYESRRNSRDQRSKSRWARSIDAALDAAAIEAVRVRKEPGPWTGRKGSRVLTAAMAAAAVGVATDHRKEDGRGDKKGKIGSALGGLVINRMLNGPRKDLRKEF